MSGWQYMIPSSKIYKVVGVGDDVVVWAHFADKVSD